VYKINKYIFHVVIDELPQSETWQQLIVDAVEVSSISSVAADLWFGGYFRL